MLESQISQYYDPPIPEELRRRYEKSLAETKRWQGVFWPPDKEESDNEHITNMFEIKRELGEKCPNLFREVNGATVDHMIYIHDGGEIAKSVGDIAHHIENYDEKKLDHKEREKRAFNLLVHRNIRDLTLRNKVLEIYGRAMEKIDKESLTTSLIDKMQGNRYGFDHVFNGVKSTRERQMVFNHAVGYIGEPMNALTQLVSEKVIIEVMDIYRGELEFYSDRGYRTEAKPYVNQLRTHLQSFLI